MVPKATPKTSYIFKGFRQEMQFRVFDFERVVLGSDRVPFTVRIDHSLARKYGIRLQELPLLCLSVLEQQSETEGVRAFTYSEELMAAFGNQKAGQPVSAKYKPLAWESSPDYLPAARRQPSR